MFVIASAVEEHLEQRRREKEAEEAAKRLEAEDARKKLDKSQCYL